MNLYINTTEKNKIFISINNGDKNLLKKSFKTKYTEAERLLLEVDKLLKKGGVKLDDLEMIKVNNISNENTSFTALRIGVVTANALGYALKIPVTPDSLDKASSKKKNISIPKYSKEPNITVKKK